MSDTPNWSFETRQIHAGQEPDTATGARALPIYQTTSYVFNDTDHAANLFALKEFGNIYTRIMNPTQDAVEQRIAALEGGVGALLVASGQAAETARPSSTSPRPATTSSPAPRSTAAPSTCCTTRCRSSASRSASSTTPTTSSRGGRRSGRTPSCSSARPSPTPRRTSSTSRASPASPTRPACRSSSTTRSRRPYLIRPLEWGADIVVHSATKYLGGHGTSIAGVIVDGGTFDYGKDPEKFPNYNTPEESYHGLVFARDLGVGGAARRQPGLHPQGARAAAARPRAGHLAVQRVPHRAGHRDAEPAHGAAPRERPQGRRVPRGARRRWSACVWASLPEHESYEKAPKYAPKGAGAVLAFEIEGGLEAGKRFVEALTLHSHVANIGDVRSLAIHPASTTHSPGPRRGPPRRRCHARAWCASRSASSTSTTSSPTSSRASPPPRPPDGGTAGGMPRGLGGDARRHPAHACQPPSQPPSQPPTG